jgi:hypothetical protein
MKTLNFVLENFFLSGIDIGCFDELSRHCCHMVLAVERDGNDFFDTCAQSPYIVSVDTTGTGTSGFCFMA